MAKNWFNAAIWDFVHYTLLLSAVAAFWVPLMNYFQGSVVPTFILEIPVIWLADKLLLHGLKPLLALMHFKTE